MTTQPLPQPAPLPLLPDALVAKKDPPPPMRTRAVRLSRIAADGSTTVAEIGKVAADVRSLRRAAHDVAHSLTRHGDRIVDWGRSPAWMTAFHVLANPATTNGDPDVRAAILREATELQLLHATSSACLAGIASTLQKAAKMAALSFRMLLQENFWRLGKRLLVDVYRRAKRTRADAMKALAWWADFGRGPFDALGIGALPLPLTERRLMAALPQVVHVAGALKPLGFYLAQANRESYPLTRAAYEQLFRLYELCTGGAPKNAWLPQPAPGLPHVWFGAMACAQRLCDAPRAEAVRQALKAAGYKHNNYADKVVALTWAGTCFKLTHKALRFGGRYGQPLTVTSNSHDARVLRSVAPAPLAARRAVQDGVGACARAATYAAQAAVCALAAPAREAALQGAADLRAEPGEAAALASFAALLGTPRELEGEACAAARAALARASACGSNARRRRRRASGLSSGNPRLRAAAGAAAALAAFEADGALAAADGPGDIGPRVAALLTARAPDIVRAVRAATRGALDGGAPLEHACAVGVRAGLDALHGAAADVADVAGARARRASLEASRAAAAAAPGDSQSGTDPYEVNGPGAMRFDPHAVRPGQAIAVGDPGKSGTAMRVVRNVAPLRPVGTRTIVFSETQAAREREAGFVRTRELSAARSRRPVPADAAAAAQPPRTVADVNAALARYAVNASGRAEHLAAAADHRQARALVERVISPNELLASAWRAFQQARRYHASRTATLSALSGGPSRAVLYMGEWGQGLQMGVQHMPGHAPTACIGNLRRERVAGYSAAFGNEADSSRCCSQCLRGRNMFNVLPTGRTVFQGDARGMRPEMEWHDVCCSRCGHWAQRDSGATRWLHGEVEEWVAAAAADAVDAVEPARRRARGRRAGVRVARARLAAEAGLRARGRALAHACTT